MTTKPLISKHHGPLFLIVALVLAWRVGAIGSPSEFLTLSPALRIPLACLGLFFLGCGILVHAKRWDSLSRLFLIYAVAGGLHWGGAIGVPGTTGVVLLCLYLGISALGEGALLHLAVSYPKAPQKLRGLAGLSYIPALLGLGLTVVCPWLPETVLETAAGILIGTTLILSLAAAVALLVRYFRRSDLKAAFRPVIYVGLGGGLMGTLGSAGNLFGLAEAWNFLFGLIPLTLARALLTNPPASVSRGD